MAGVERPHRWHQRNRARQLRERLLKLCASGYGAHRLAPELARKFVKGGDEGYVPSDPLRCGGEVSRFDVSPPSGEGRDGLITKVGDAPSVARCCCAEETEQIGEHLHLRGAAGTCADANGWLEFSGYKFLVSQ